MERSLAGHPDTLIRGREYDLPADLAKQYIERKLAVPVVANTRQTATPQNITETRTNNPITKKTARKK